MTQDTGGGPELAAQRDHLLPRPGPEYLAPDQPGPGSQHIGALVGALSVLDTRLLDDWGQRLAVVTRRGGRLLVAGSGGSAAQAGQFAAQFAGYDAAGRRQCHAIALHAVIPAVAAIAGDGCGHEEVLARQVRSHGRPGDVLLTMSNSGRDYGLLHAVAAARAGGIVAWCLTGPAPNPLADACDEAVCVYPAGARALSLPATVQEAHQVALHLICLSFDAAAMAGQDVAADAGSPAGF
jgi:D-sedoheptulose 7-phosphate isomerase